MLLFLDRFVVLSLSTVIKSCQQMEINEGFSCHPASTPANACPAPDRGPCSPSPSIPQYLGLSEVCPVLIVAVAWKNDIRVPLAAARYL